MVMVPPHQQCRPGISIFQTAHWINRRPNEPSDKSKTAHKSRSTATPADRPSKSKTEIQYKNPKVKIQRRNIQNINSKSNTVSSAEHPANPQYRKGKYKRRKSAKLP